MMVVGDNLPCRLDQLFNTRSQTMRVGQRKTSAVGNVMELVAKDESHVWVVRVGVRRPDGSIDMTPRWDAGLRYRWRIQEWDKLESSDIAYDCENCGSGQLPDDNGKCPECGYNPAGPLCSDCDTPLDEFGQCPYCLSARIM